MTNEIINWALPESLKVPADELRLRLDFYNQAVVLNTYENKKQTTRIVSAMDVAHALAKELSFGTGLLPDNVLWWTNSNAGPVYAIWEAPRKRVVALQETALKAPKRFNIPLPGLIFLCSPGKPPWVYAAKKRPTKATDIIYRAPLCNIFNNGRSCPGNHKYPERVQDVVESFFMAFFSATADLQNRSIKHKSSVVKLWESLDGAKQYPLNDLVKHGTVHDLLQMEMN